MTESQSIPDPKSLRLDNDQWDIVSSVGYTALLVAAWRALHSASPQPVVRDEYAQYFITASADPYLISLLANPGTSQNANVIPRLLAVQTRFFDDYFYSAGAVGIRQAVIVAAGLDSRAYRLDWPSETTVFEVDMPKVLEFKASVLSERGAQAKARRCPVAIDLRADWATPLKAAGFNPQQPSAWLVEGLFPYLTGQAQNLFLARVDDLSAPGSQLAVGALGSGLDLEQFATLEATHPGINVLGAVDFSALSYDDTKTDPAEWLSAHGWSVEPTCSVL